MKRHLFLFAAMLLTMTAMTGCFKDKPDTSKEGLYVGIIGFNDEIQSKKLTLLNDATKDEMREYINGLTMKPGTALYHAVNTAIEKIESITPPQDLINVSIVTFTDGLDQGSYMLNNNFSSNSEYLAAVNRKIKSTSIGDVPISAYSIGVRGSDVNNATTFHQNLEKLSSSPNNVYEVASMTEVSQIFSSIAEDLYHQSSSWDVTLKAPGMDSRTRIRFTFDANINNGDESEHYIEGLFVIQDNVPVLRNVKYVGLQNCGSEIYPETEGIFYIFTFSNLLYPDGEPVYTTNAKQWIWYPESGANGEWGVNSEFSPNSNTVTKEEFKSALIMLVLDCSSSLGNDFQSMKSAACQFIETLNGKTHQ